MINTGRQLRGEEKKLWGLVRKTLWEYEPLRASHAEIDIDVHGRNVRLAGRVRTLPQKIVAETLVKRLPEVEMVSDELISDTEVVRAVADTLAQDARTAPYVIRVDSRHGVVSLEGTVPNEKTRKSALEVAARAPFVALVRDRLTLGGETYRPTALTRQSTPQPAAEAGHPQVGPLDAPGSRP